MVVEERIELSVARLSVESFTIKLLYYGTPGTIRTYILLIRSQTLDPVQLQGYGTRDWNRTSMDIVQRILSPLRIPVPPHEHGEYGWSCTNDRRVATYCLTTWLHIHGAAHRIRTYKSFQTNCFQDSSLTTRTCGSVNYWQG